MRSPSYRLQHSIISNSLPGENVTQPWKKKKIVSLVWGPEKCLSMLNRPNNMVIGNMVTLKLCSVVRNPLTLISDGSLLRVI